jgi:ubiquinone/menaquinone biosynthesis C-methylase UbiE
MSQSTSDSREYFETVAPGWESMREGFFSEDVLEAALAAAEVPRQGEGEALTAVDVGAGSGFVTRGLLARGLRVVAVDRSRAMLEELKRLDPGAGVLEVREGEGGALPLADAAMDYVFANMFLHHVEDPGAVIKDMARVLKPGGRLVITDLDRHDFTFLLEEHHDRWPGFLREDVERWFVEAGLTRVSVDCADTDCSCESETGQGAASISVFVATGRRPD